MIDELIIGFCLFSAFAVVLWIRFVWITHGYTWRLVQLDFAMVLLAMGQRLLDHAQRPTVPNGEKLIIRIRDTWEDKWPRVSAERLDDDEIAMRAGPRVIRFKCPARVQ